MTERKINIRKNMAYIKESLKSQHFFGLTTSGTKVTLGRMKTINGFFLFCAFSGGASIF